MGGGECVENNSPPKASLLCTFPTTIFPERQGEREAEEGCTLDQLDLDRQRVSEGGRMVRKNGKEPIYSATRPAETRLQP